MKVAEKVEGKINRMKAGTTFKYQQLNISPGEYTAAAKAIERLIEKKVIKRVSTGVFYKPKNTVFGELKPREEELIKPYLFEQNKRIAYVTGLSLYNRMGLTSQVPGTVKVASRVKRIRAKIGDIEIKPVKSYINVTNDNYYLLEILDVLKDFKIIPDLDKRMLVNVLVNKIRKLNKGDLSRMMKFALQYPPRTRALLGALINIAEPKADMNILLKSINPLTQYNLGISDNILPTVKKWNIR